MAWIENPRTGERVRFVSESDEALVMEARWPPGAARTPPHAHPGMEERWEVVEGRAAFVIGDVESSAGPGEGAVAPPGAFHQAWNAGEEEALVRIEMRPALRWRSFVERLFAGEHPAVLLAEHPEELRL